MFSVSKNPYYIESNIEPSRYLWNTMTNHEESFGGLCILSFSSFNQNWSRQLIKLITLWNMKSWMWSPDSTNMWFVFFDLFNNRTHSFWKMWKVRYLLFDWFPQLSLFLSMARHFLCSLAQEVVNQTSQKVKKSVR